MRAVLTPDVVLWCRETHAKRKRRLIRRHSQPQSNDISLIRHHLDSRGFVTASRAYLPCLNLAVLSWFIRGLFLASFSVQFTMTATIAAAKITTLAVHPMMMFLIRRVALSASASNAIRDTVSGVSFMVTHPFVKSASTSNSL